MVVLMFFWLRVMVMVLATSIGWYLESHGNKFVVFGLHFRWKSVNNLRIRKRIKFIGGIVPKAHHAFIIQIKLSGAIVLWSHFWCYKYYFILNVYLIYTMRFPKHEKTVILSREPPKGSDFWFVGLKWEHLNFMSAAPISKCINLLIYWKFLHFLIMYMSALALYPPSTSIKVKNIWYFWQVHIPTTQ